MEQIWEVLRSEYESCTIPELIGLLGNVCEKVPRKGKMSEKTYKKMLINFLLKEQLKYVQDLNIVLNKSSKASRKNIIGRANKENDFLTNIFLQTHPEFRYAI